MIERGWFGVSRLALILLVFAALKAESKPQIPFGNQCFDQVEHRGLSNAQPVGELWNVSPFDCLAHCILNAAKSGDGCASVVYHKHFSACQLYNHDGNYAGSKVVFASGHDFYNRTSYGGECADRYAPSRGYPQGQDRPKALAQDSSPTSEDSSQLFPLSEKQAFKPIKVEPKKKTDSFLLANTPATKGCANGQKISYFAARSFIPPLVEPKALIRGIDAEACLIYCSQNINVAGDQTPCTLTVYNYEQEICELYDESVKELGIFTRLQNATAPGRLSAEKFCVPDQLECAPDSAHLVHFGRKIPENIIGQVTRLDTVPECLSVCLRNPACKSVTFKSGRCLLHAETPFKDAKTSNMIETDSPSSMVIDAKCTKL